MANIAIRTTYEIPELFEGQAIIGKVATSYTYNIQTEDNESKIGITVSDIKIVENDAEIFYSIKWFDNGPINLSKNPESILLSQIKAAEPVFVHYEKNRSRIKNNTPKYYFTFETEHGPYNINIADGEFICAMVKNPNGNRNSVFGFVTDAYEDESTGKNMIIMEAYENTKGLYKVYDKEIDTDDIVGIFRYKIELKPFISKKKNAQNVIE